MIRGRWFAIAVATLVWSIALWFGFLSLSTDRAVAVVLIGIGLASALWFLTILSADGDGRTRGLAGTLAGLGSASLLLAVGRIGGIDTLVVIAPVVGAGLGGMAALAPPPDTVRALARAGGVAFGVAVASSLHGVDPTLYGVLAPLLSFPLLGLADHYHDRLRGVTAGMTAD